LVANPNAHRFLNIKSVHEYEFELKATVNRKVRVYTIGHY